MSQQLAKGTPPPQNAEENNSFKIRLIQMAKEVHKANEEKNALKRRIG